jgi:hypothetical protein
MLLTSNLLGDRPLRNFTVNRRRGVDITTFRSSSGVVHVVVVDERPHHDRPLPVVLRLPRSFTSGVIERLTARLPSSTSGTRLAGRPAGRDGSWAPAADLPHLGGRPGRLTLTVPAGSAALVTARLRGN